MIRLIFLILLAPFSIFLSRSQGYSPPLRIPLTLAANFGELRTNHFHMGLDFKTNGKEGLEILSIADGFISRIKVSPYGYGKAIYIEHPDGKTSVYGHCSAFKGNADSIVKAIQELEENAEIDVYFTPNELPVKKGQVIAYSGNTGRSSAPHLHFELRDTKTGDALNPILHGFTINDHRPAELYTLKFYALSEEGYPIPGKSKEYRLKKNSTGNFVIAERVLLPSTFFGHSGGIGIAVQANDKYDGSDNLCGIYEANLIMEGLPQKHTRIDRISFESSRYINAYTDHPEFIKGRDFHHLFHASEDPLTIHKGDLDGILMIQPGQVKNCVLRINDESGNTSVLSFVVTAENGKRNISDPFPENVYFDPAQQIRIEEDTPGKARISLDPHTLYVPLKREFSLTPPYYLGSNNIPIQKDIRIEIPSPKMDHVYLEVLDEKGRPKAHETVYASGYYLSFPKNLGIFRLKKDPTGPSVTWKGRSGKFVSWTVSEHETEIFDYDLFVDGEWVLLEYESKKDLLFAALPPGNGNRRLKLIVTDLAGNKTIKEMELP